MLIFNAISRYAVLLQIQNIFLFISQYPPESLLNAYKSSRFIDNLISQPGNQTKTNQTPWKKCENLRVNKIYLGLKEHLE